MTIMYGLIPSVDALQQYTSMAVQLKILTALIGLVYFRWKKPYIERPIKVVLHLMLYIMSIVYRRMSSPLIAVF